MKKNIEHILDTLAPSVTDVERARMWSTIEATLTDRAEISSPFFQIFYTRKMEFALLMLFLILIGGSATVVTAEAARPGDTLFPLEQAIEHVRLRLAKDDADRGRLANTFAEERLRELRSIVGERSGARITPDDDARVSAAVTALVRVMDESNMSNTAREKLYTHLFTEIDTLSIDVRVADKRDSKTTEERVKVRRDETGSTFEIRNEGVRTRIEKKNGEVRIEEEQYDNEKNEDADDSNPETSSEVRGVMTGSRTDDSDDDKKNRRNRQTGE